MVLGLFASLLGSQAIDGGVTGIIALGLFPIAWIPLYRTVTDIQDSLAAVVARFVERKDPGRVLVACEFMDAVLTALVVIMLLLTPSSWLSPVLMVYLLVTSFFPLIVDLAEELYLNDVGQLDATLVVRANTFIAVGTAVSGLLIGRPLGALTSEYGILIVLIINLVTSIVAVCFRYFSSRTFTPPHVAEDEEELTPSGFLSAVRHFFFPHSASVLFQNRYLSPIFSFLSSFAAAVLGIYVVLWAAGSGEGAAARLAILLFIIGIAGALTPLVVGKLVERHRDRVERLMAVLLLLVCVGGAISLGIVLFVSLSFWATVGVMAGYVLTSSSMLGVRFAISTVRQIKLSQKEFRQVVGWSFSLTAIGGICGIWLGYLLNAATDPTAAMIVSLIVSVGLLLWVRHGYRPNTAEPSGNGA